jgi:hypothetical protein
MPGPEEQAAAAGVEIGAGARGAAHRSLHVGVTG